MRFSVSYTPPGLLRTWNDYTTLYNRIRAWEFAMLEADGSCTDPIIANIRKIREEYYGS